MSDLIGERAATTAAAYREQSVGLWWDDAERDAFELAERRHRKVMRLARMYARARELARDTVTAKGHAEWHKRSTYYYCRLSQAVRDLSKGV